LRVAWRSYWPFTSPTSRFTVVGWSTVSSSVTTITILRTAWIVAGTFIVFATKTIVEIAQISNVSGYNCK